MHACVRLQLNNTHAPRAHDPCDKDPRGRTLCESIARACEKLARLRKRPYYVSDCGFNAVVELVLMSDSRHESVPLAFAPWQLAVAMPEVMAAHGAGGAPDYRRLCACVHIALATVFPCPGTLVPYALAWYVDEHALTNAHGLFLTLALRYKRVPKLAPRARRAVAAVACAVHALLHYIPRPETDGSPGMASVPEALELAAQALVSAPLRAGRRGQFMRDVHAHFICGYEAPQASDALVHAESIAYVLLENAFDTDTADPNVLQPAAARGVRGENVLLLPLPLPQLLAGADTLTACAPATARAFAAKLDAPLALLFTSTPAYAVHAMLAGAAAPAGMWRVDDVAHASPDGVTLLIGERELLLDWQCAVAFSALGIALANAPAVLQRACEGTHAGRPVLVRAAALHLYDALHVHVRAPPGAERPGMLATDDARAARYYRMLCVIARIVGTRRSPLAAFLRPADAHCWTATLAALMRTYPALAAQIGPHELAAPLQLDTTITLYAACANSARELAWRTALLDALCAARPVPLHCPSTPRVVNLDVEAMPARVRALAVLLCTHARDAAAAAQETCQSAAAIAASTAECARAAATHLDATTAAAVSGNAGSMSRMADAADAAAAAASAASVAAAAHAWATDCARPAFVAPNEAANLAHARESLSATLERRLDFATLILPHVHGYARAPNQAARIVRANAPALLNAAYPPPEFPAIERPMYNVYEGADAVADLLRLWECDGGVTPDMEKDAYERAIAQLSVGKDAAPPPARSTK